MRHHVIKNIARERRREKRMLNKPKNNKRLREYNPDNSYIQPKIGDLL